MIRDMNRQPRINEDILWSSKETPPSDSSRIQYRGWDISYPVKDFRLSCRDWKIYRKSHSNTAPLRYAQLDIQRSRSVSPAVSSDWEVKATSWCPENDINSCWFLRLLPMEVSKCQTSLGLQNLINVRTKNPTNKTMKQNNMKLQKIYLEKQHHRKSHKPLSNQETTFFSPLLQNCFFSIGGSEGFFIHRLVETRLPCGGK